MSTPRLSDRTPWHPVADATEFLCGIWDIRREITENGTQRGVTRHLGGGDFTGTLSIEPSEHGLQYRETGVFRWRPGSLGDPAAPGTQEVRADVSRRYLLCRTADPATVDWYFDHGGFFHRLDLSSGWWQAYHPCAEDRYQAEYQVLNSDELTVIWEVTGPAKNQVLRSDWSRR